MIITDLPISNYHNAIHPGKEVWLSKTTLREFSEMGPAWWKLANIDKVIAKERPGGALQGLALDCYLTEGSAAFYDRFAIKPPDMSFATKEGKAWKAEHEGKEFLSDDDHAIMLDAADAVRRCSRWPEIEKSKAQATIRRHSDGLGLGLQSRPDWLNVGCGTIDDLKKTANLDTFGKQAIDLSYHLQAAIAGWCLVGDNIQLEHAYLVAVEWARGARCRVYEIPHDVLEYADKQMRKVAAEIADRLERNDWTDKQESTEQLPVPEWYRRRMNEDMERA